VIASGRINLDDIRHADVAVANIQQIAVRKIAGSTSLNRTF
jgi:hypothetical protein